MANFVNMLFEFGEYSGVGIKTSLGMGYMKIINEGEENDNGRSDKINDWKSAS